MIENNLDDILKQNLLLKEENERLKKLAHILFPLKIIPNDKPFANVILYNQVLAQKYRNDIEAVIISKAADMANSQCIGKGFKIPNGTVDLKNCISNEDIYVKNSSFSVIACVQYYDIYSIDALGDGIYSYGNGMDQSWMVPLYDIIFFVSLGDMITDDIDLLKPQNYGPKCFNCDGPHIISACLQKLDYKKIAKNKSEFLSRTISQSSNNRYHVEVEPRFAKFEPGTISDNLREALGLRSDELPPYIYMMRTLGYPPGHFIQARKALTNILLFKDVADKEANGIDHPDKDDAADSYDIDKIVTYHGFNAPIPRHFKDEYQKYGSIPMQNYHNKSTWRNTLSKLAKTSRQKLDRSSDKRDVRQNGQSDKVSNSSSSRRRLPETVDLDSDADASPEDRNRPNFNCSIIGDCGKSNGDQGSPAKRHKRRVGDDVSSAGNSLSRDATLPEVDSSSRDDDSLSRVSNPTPSKESGEGQRTTDHNGSRPGTPNGLVVECVTISSSSYAASRACVKGTPVFNSAKRKHVSISETAGTEGDSVEFFESVPSLDSFAHDIQPFSYDKEWDLRKDASAAEAGRDGDADINAAYKRGIFEKIKRAFDGLKQKRLPR